MRVYTVTGSLFNGATMLLLLLLMQMQCTSARFNLFGGGGGHKRHKERHKGSGGGSGGGFGGAGGHTLLEQMTKHLIEEQKHDRLFPTVLQFDRVDKAGRFSLLSVLVNHAAETPWYVPSLHHKFSVGWNRTVNRGFLNKPHACEFRFVGIALEKTLAGYVRGGTGYLTMQVGSRFHHGYDKNETLKVCALCCHLVAYLAGPSPTAPL